MPCANSAQKTKPNPIRIAADHGGFELKQYLTEKLCAAGHEVVDFGDHQLKPNDDYPDFGVALARAVADGRVECGMVICGSAELEKRPAMETP
jgi:ribose 5-phosphate isomerase B